MADRRAWCVLLIIVAVGLTLRLAGWYALSGAGEAWDGLEYFLRALGFHDIFQSLLQGEPPKDNDLVRAYSTIWPPAHSALLGLGMLITSADFDGARLATVLLSSLTIPLVYRVAKRFTGTAAALVAAAIFSVYPAFVHYSLRLYSETTFLFLVFCVLLVAPRIWEHRNVFKHAMAWALFTGALLGVVTLTRAVGLFWIVGIVIWLTFSIKPSGRGMVLAAALIGAAMVVLLPWQIIVYVKDGRIVPVTTSSALNVYLGTVHGGTRDEKKQLAKQHAAEHDLTVDEAYRALAIRNIASDPLAYARHAIGRMGRLWQMDSFSLRYLTQVIPPPVSVSALLWIVVAVAVSILLYLPLAAWGLLIDAPSLKYRGLLVALLLCGSFAHALTIATPRFGVPLQAVLLPAVGHGFVVMISGRGLGRRLAWFAALAVFAVAGWRAQQPVSQLWKRLTPSSYYAEARERLPGLVGPHAVFGDRLILRANEAFPFDEGVVLLLVPESGAKLTIDGAGPYSGDGAQERVGYEGGREWKPVRAGETLAVVTTASDPSRPLSVEVSRSEGGIEAVLILDTVTWQTWRSSELPGLDYMWVSGHGVGQRTVEKMLRAKGLLD